MSQEGFARDGGLVIRVMDFNTEPIRTGFMLEISRFS
jgi:hypothetical protein